MKQSLPATATCRVVAAEGRATTTLTLLRDMAIPVLPAVVLNNPKLWCNIWPLATFNLMSQGRFAVRPRPDIRTQTN